MASSNTHTAFAPMKRYNILQCQWRHYAIHWLNNQLKNGIHILFRSFDFHYGHLLKETVMGLIFATSTSAAFRYYFAATMLTFSLFDKDWLYSFPFDTGPILAMKNASSCHYQTWDEFFKDLLRNSSCFNCKWLFFFFLDLQCCFYLLQVLNFYP